MVSRISTSIGGNVECERVAGKLRKNFFQSQRKAT